LLVFMFVYCRYKSVVGIISSIVTTLHNSISDEANQGYFIVFFFTFVSLNVYNAERCLKLNL
jgi:hypothetical protein